MINEILKQRRVKGGRMRTCVPPGNEREEELDKKRRLFEPHGTFKRKQF